ncbi:hypothetical protein [Candidatus Ichthyocystis sparus]|uniref:hypothetical protein n=1 Tax=Candidatus Ichthyocystis sparus TaxID=1561004 RepID=UPI0011468DF6|nr:hypothetical protein [Candidatus Ichthyocystis sparus]
MYPYSLEHLPYIEFKVVDKITKNPVILNSLSIWKLNHKLAIRFLFSPFSPIWKNPSITCCMDDTFKLWYDEGIQELCHLFDNGTFLSFAQLQQRYGFPPSHLFRFFQTRHALDIENGSLQETTPSEIDSILNIKKQDKQKVISN